MTVAGILVNNYTSNLIFCLRIGWAEPKSTTKVMKPRKEPKHGETAQIHVSFISKQVKNSKYSLYTIFNH